MSEAVKGVFDPSQLSDQELDDYLDELVAGGDEDSQSFHRAYAEWEGRHDQ